MALVADMDKLWAIGGYDGMKNLKTVSFISFVNKNKNLGLGRRSSAACKPQ